MSFAIIPSEEISHRFDFALLANARGYRDAVEIGTDLGVFARDFLSRFTGNWLILVDPYEPYPDFPYDRTGDMLVAATALAPYHGRYKFVRARSPDCASWVTTFVSPEFVYLDGSHDEADVAADLEAWWAILPETGMLCGHDFDEAHPGVMSAVKAFARERGLVVRLTHEPDPVPKSWYVYKVEPPTLFVRLFRSADEPNPHSTDCRRGTTLPGRFRVQSTGSFSPPQLRQ